ncbi:MAG: NAD(P)H-hydrate dehydratase [Eubacteriales bacterium]|jgi:hydroxyethylthiazole kinase-like uncharacterized protein yjeF|nr:NAD(P)H-hydrate dehydratase [Eubacteriales bacterium]
MSTITVTLTEAFNILKKRPYDSNKSHFGTVTIIAGSSHYRGAAALAVSAALRCGSGIVCLASTEKVIESAAAKIYECTYFPLAENDSGSISSGCADALIYKAGKSSSCLAGCGMTLCEDTRVIIRELIYNAQCQLILDADALNAISGCSGIIEKAVYPPVITPHVGEMARLTGLNIAGIKSDREHIALEYAREKNCIVALKDYITCVASPAGQLYVNNTGNAGLAKGGSGDVLAGMIASFSAQIPAYKAAVLGVYLHGLAADRCAVRLSQYGMLPSDILYDLCCIFKENDR